PSSPSFPYTTLFRSARNQLPVDEERRRAVDAETSTLVDVLLHQVLGFPAGDALVELREVDSDLLRVRLEPLRTRVGLAGEEHVRSEEHTSELQSLRH